MGYQLMQINEARQKLGWVGRTKLYELMDEGEVESVKIGKRRLVVERSLDDYIERQLVAQRSRAGDGASGSAA